MNIPTKPWNHEDYVKGFSLPWFCSELTVPAYHPCVCVRACACTRAQMDAQWDLEPERTAVTLCPAAPCSIRAPPASAGAPPRAPVCGLPESRPCHVSCWLRRYHWLFDYFRGWLDFLFLFIYCLVMRSFNFCLNFVCLSFSLLACSPVCPRCFADCLRCSFPAASSVHQVQAADLRRVSAPPGSFTMWVQSRPVFTLCLSPSSPPQGQPTCTLSLHRSASQTEKHLTVTVCFSPSLIWDAAVKFFVFYLSQSSEFTV